MSDRVTMFRYADTIIYIQGIPGSYGYRSLEIIYYIKDIQALTVYTVIQNTKDHMVHEYTTDIIHIHIKQINGKE